MNALGPPIKKRGMGAALKTTELLASYRLLSLLQAPFEFWFWLIEQRKARLQDRIDHEGNAG